MERYKKETSQYLAPELFGQEPFDGALVDMFAMGVCLFNMVEGTSPFNRATDG